jgi:HEAT repeat protein
LPYGLGHEDADNRKDAAEDLRDDGGPPPAAVPHLFTALQREPDDDARKQILITLGASGVPDARRVLESYLRHPNDETREGAEKGLELWSKKTGQAMPRQMGEIAKLESPDWEVRREAADDLADDNGPPKEAVAPLVAAAGKERYPKALGAMLLTLGKSGAPEAKPVIEGHVDSKDTDVRRYARRAQKSWLLKNGHTVRKDVETPAPAPPPVATATAAAAPPAPAPPAQDGCDQFKGICGADPFSLDKCKNEMKPLSYSQQQVWADCVNSSTATCQKAHDTCVVKAKSAK